MADKEDPKSFWGMVYRLLSEGDSGEVWKGVFKIAGAYALVLAPMFVMIGGMGLLTWISKPENYFPARKCLDVKEVNGTVYKIDQCKNTIEVIARPVAPKKPEPVPAKTEVKPSAQTTPGPPNSSVPAAKK